jgi:hypothetical protein
MGVVLPMMFGLFLLAMLKFAGSDFEPAEKGMC